MNEELQLEKRLEALKLRHRELDARINELDPRTEAFLYARLKKEKLALRDEISYIESILYPDVVA